MSAIPVTQDFLQKVVGFIEVTKGMMDKAATDQAAREKFVEKLVGANTIKAADGEVLTRQLTGDIEKAYEFLAKLAGTGKKQEPEKKAVEPMGAPAEKTVKSAQATDGVRESDQLWDSRFGL